MLYRQQRTEELRPAQVHEVWGGTTAEALHDEYNDIFPKTNNSNAASHVWSSSVLRRSMQLQPSQIRELVSGRCFVSGSSVSPVSAFMAAVSEGAEYPSAGRYYHGTPICGSI